MKSSLSMRMILFMILLAALFFIAMPQSAEAYTSTVLPAPAGITAECQNLTQYGVTVGLVYCMKQSINAGATSYITKMAVALEYYRYLMLVLVITFFGMRIMTASIEDILKDTMSLLFKVAVTFYVIANLPGFYNSATSAMGEMIGWVSLGFSHINAGCTPPALPGGVNPSEYVVWQEFDCMFSSMLGVVAGNPGAVSTSAVAIIAAALLTGMMGLILVIIAVTASIMGVFLVARSIYMVLLAYITIAFLLLLAPLIMPIWMFHVKFAQNIFDKWLGLIVSTMFEPFFIIGFLSMAVLVVDTFIEGPMPATYTVNGQSYPGCVPPPMPNVGPAGQCIMPDPTATGSGICALKQIINPNNLNDAQQAIAFECEEEPNATLFSWKITGDPQSHNDDGGWHPIDWISGKIKSGAVSLANHALSMAGDLSLSGFTRLRMSIPVMLQFMMTEVAFIIVVAAMFSLINEIPRIARSITLNTGLSLYKNARPPLEGTIAAGVKGMGDALREWVGAKGGGSKGVKNAPRAAIAGVRGGIKGMAKHIASKNL